MSAMKWDTGEHIREASGYLAQAAFWHGLGAFDLAELSDDDAVQLARHCGLTFKDYVATVHNIGILFGPSTGLPLRRYARAQRRRLEREQHQKQREVTRRRSTLHVVPT
jgi:hypothetical protein